MTIIPHSTQYQMFRRHSLPHWEVAFFGQRWTNYQLYWYYGTIHQVWLCHVLHDTTILASMNSIYFQAQLNNCGTGSTDYMVLFYHSKLYEMMRNIGRWHIDQIKLFASLNMQSKTWLQIRVKLVTSSDSMCLRGPMPESIRIWADPTVPALKITSFLARLCRTVLLWTNSTP